MKIKPTKNYDIMHPKDEDGEDIKYSLVLTLGHKTSNKVGDATIGARLDEALDNIGAFDSVAPMGMFSIGITIARTFDADEVLAELRRYLDEEIFSKIVVPRLELS